MSSDPTGSVFSWLITPETATRLNNFSLSGGLFPTYVSRFALYANIYAEYIIDRVDI